MSRNRFQDICGLISLMLPSTYDNDAANDDPLWSCRSVLDQFIQKSATVAVPVGVSALDEDSCATKAHTRAKTHLHLVNRISMPYDFMLLLDISMFIYRPCMMTEQGTTQVSLASKIIVEYFVSQTASLKASNGHNLIFCVNLYTRHSLVAALCKFSDGDVKIVGTVKFTKLGATNHFCVSQGIECLKNSNRGEWF
jgi:hypothetical protein